MRNSSSNPDLAAQAAQFRQNRATERSTSSSSPPLQKRRSLLSSQYSQEDLEASPQNGFENGLGTWAGRQQVFSRVSCEEDQEENFEKEARRRDAVFGPNIHLPNGESSNEIDNNSTLQRSNSPEDLIQAAEVAPTIDSLQPRHYQNQQSGESTNEDADIQAAWKWRFSRKWQKEQLRQLEGATSIEPGDDDEWSTALDYMSAAAGGLNLQFGRTMSLLEDHGECLDPNLSQSMSSFLLEASLSRGESLAFSQGTTGTLEQTTTPMASRHIAQAVHKAEQLMAHQQEIEKAVAEQWQKHESQQPWAAQSIPAVNIDSWGTFSFVLARVMDFASGRQKLIIRGRNRFSVKQGGDALQQEVTAEALNRRLSVPKVDILGSGKIEWSRERDRCLIITGSAVHSALDTRLKRKEDVGRVAGALVRTGLPALHTVIVADGGGRQTAHNGGSRTTSS
jgi:hypothetical protein